VGGRGLALFISIPFRGAQRAGCGKINQTYSSNMQIKSPTQLLASPHWRRKPSSFPAAEKNQNAAAALALLKIQTLR